MTEAKREVGSEVFMGPSDGREREGFAFFGAVYDAVERTDRRRDRFPRTSRDIGVRDQISREGLWDEDLR
jgi:hypothetical protein